MLYSEFYERTKKEVSAEEYRFIEDSYYEFDGDKDQFCKAWLRDRKNGTWEKELRLRKKIAYQEEEFKEKEKEYEENLEFYRPYFEKALQASKDLDTLKRHMQGLLQDVESYEKNAF